MVQDSTGSALLAHVSHRPAKANNSPCAGWMKNGCFALPTLCHSKNPDAGMRQRKAAWQRWNLAG